MQIRFRKPLDRSRYAEWAAAVPAIIGGVSALASSRGSKKAAAGAKPKVPGGFANPLAAALGSPGANAGNGLLGDLMRGFKPYPGGSLNPLQAMSMQQAGSSFGAGQAGLQSAQGTLQTMAGSGINPQDINTATGTLAPYFDFLRQQGLAQTREGEAQGGRFFGSGGQNAEGLFNASLAGQQSAQTLPFAVQNAGLRLAGAQGLQSNIAAQQGLNESLFNMGGAARQQDLQEFLRQQPEMAIPLLAQLMSGTPLFQQPIGTNFLQGLGGMGNSLLGSGGFWNYLSGLTNRPSGGANVGAYTGNSGDAGQIDPFGGY